MKTSKRNSTAKFVGAVAIAAGLVLSPSALVTPAIAQSATVDLASISPADLAAMSAEALAAAFKTDPAAFLAKYPNGGVSLTLAIQKMLLSDPAMAEAVVAAISCDDPAVTTCPNPAQVNAVASALATAAASLAATNPEAANAIQLAVANSGDPALQTAYATASGASATAAGPAPQQEDAVVVPAAPIGDTGDTQGNTGDVTEGGMNGSGGSTLGGGGAGNTTTTGGGAVSPTV